MDYSKSLRKNNSKEFRQNRLSASARSSPMLFF
jgi:hypothetical protein